ncbi:MAG TPA: hypothetical protein VK669_05840 [Candidatus Limnocylindrales bacterium]|nr:hypothetical protein [Candidatus Limnocylindrales bacterium]
MQTQPKPALLHFDNLNDGEVEEFSWGTAVGSRVGINAAGVRDAGVFYGQYTFDPATQTLHVTTPTAAPPPSAIVPNDPNAPLIQTLDIAAWGSSAITPPLPFVGPPTGTITFAFRQRTSVSGPIGGANGP